MSACQFVMVANQPCPEPARFRQVFKSASGFAWAERTCRGHADARLQQVRAEGGELLDVETLLGEESAS